MIVIVTDLDSIQRAESRSGDGFRPRRLVRVEDSVRRLKSSIAAKGSVGGNVFAVGIENDGFVQVEEKGGSDGSSGCGTLMNALDLKIVPRDQVIPIDHDRLPVAGIRPRGLPYLALST